ncbi:hypothetical protein DS909_21580 [Phaeobacter gallaeciensis]|uniref:Uncharacterized protein n=2 Tax=Roseobacteraceae TaxID=2854170 RepID=A0A366WKW2_9RHOB|nr:MULTISPECIES: hypothetical protein [Roseobacteraceae]MBT3140165.1 hypothetical protein [Falsiruegeria litorea]MBT8169076.1 hypothetical protein [Falsiruegeria litorea]RBW50454.1 hypothetical protein DS909_21580 [Phaeobacter gallaeciensis]
MPVHRPSDTYSPLYFLASLGAGGLTVTFFMYLMFWVPHTGRPVPLLSDILTIFETGPTTLKIAALIAMLGIASFAILNVALLVWNLRAYSAFRQTEAYNTLMQSNGQSATLAMPLAMAMTVNAMFIVGLVFVPGLWSVVEYLFPLAVLAFLGIGALALIQTSNFLGRALTHPEAFSIEGHNSFAQMMPAFALSMVAVGLAAPAAMSHTPAIVGLSLVASTFFAIAAVIYALFAAITGLNAMLTHGTAREAGPTLMVIIPIMTVLGILSLRQTHGLDGLGDGHTAASDTFLFLTRLLSIQLVFLGLGLVVLRRQKYFADFVFGSKTSPGSYALVCPGVALSVLIQFWVNKGLVGAGLLDKFSPTYWAITLIALALQAAMVTLVLRLNRQHFGRPKGHAAVPAE